MAASFASARFNSACRCPTVAWRSAFSSSAMVCPAFTESPMFARSFSTFPETRAPTRTCAPTCGLTAPVARTEEEKSRRTTCVVVVPGSAVPASGRAHHRHVAMPVLATTTQTRRSESRLALRLLPRFLCRVSCPSDSVGNSSGFGRMVLRVRGWTVAAPTAFVRRLTWLSAIGSSIGRAQCVEDSPLFLQRSRPTPGARRGIRSNGTTTIMICPCGKVNYPARISKLAIGPLGWGDMYIIRGASAIRPARESRGPATTGGRHRKARARSARVSPPSGRNNCGQPLTNVGFPRSRSIA